MFKQAFIELRMTNNRYLPACQLNVGRNSDSVTYRCIAAERVAGVTFRHNRWSLTIRTSQEHSCPQTRLLSILLASAFQLQSARHVSVEASRAYA
jgi:hypothetical protein